MSDTYYNKLKELVESGRLSIHFIVAPPRTNSSLIEHALGNSPDIHHECHEPFLGARKEDFDPDHGYKQIFDSINGEEFEKGEGKTSVVVKEMSHWIGVNEEYKRLVRLTDKPVLVLTRNPLLSVESRIRKVTATLDMRSNLPLQQYLLDYLAKSKGFNSWNDVIQAEGNDRKTEIIELLRNGEDIERLYDVTALSVQNKLLDYLAREHGHVNWQDAVTKKLYEEKDYAFFENILKSNTRRLEFEKDEFKRLSEEVEYFTSIGKDHFIFDTTDVRAAPEEQLTELCNRMGITFTPEMVEWGKKPVDFHTEQTQEFEKLWYDTLYLSSRIKPPTEPVPRLDMFPEFVKEYLSQDNLKIYAELSKRKVLSDELRRELNEREFLVQVNDSNREYLVRIGVIEADSPQTEVSVQLKYIDPIYALTNDPSLIEDREFNEITSQYSRELEIVHDIVSEQNEHTKEQNREQNNKGGEMKFR
jgi:hypothetical protein